MKKITKNIFLLYGKALNSELFHAFEKKCNIKFDIIGQWKIADIQHYRVEGQWDKAWQANAHQLQFDIALLDFDTNLAQSGLVVMDMDSTMIEIECIDEIAKLAGVGEKVSKITQQAMEGKLDFEQSLRQRVETLVGTPQSVLAQLLSTLPLMPGLQETIMVLKENGWKIAIASGGFSYFANHLQQKLHLDYATSNKLEIVNGKITGKVLGQVVDAKHKAETLKMLAKKFAIPIKQCIAIGDGANDLKMLEAAGIGIAFHAKLIVQQQAKIAVNFADLTALLSILSVNDKRILEN